MITLIAAGKAAYAGERRRIETRAEPKARSRLLRTSVQWRCNMQVSDILQEKGNRVVSVDANASAADIAVVLRSEKIGAALVRKGEAEPLGIVSERDIVHAVAERGESALQLTASELMSRAIVTCAPEASTTEIMEQMLENQIRHLPVTSDGSVVGIISIGDVVRAVHGELSWMTKVLHDQVVTSAGWATDEA